MASVAAGHWPAAVALALIGVWYYETFLHWRMQYGIKDYYTQAALVPPMVLALVWLRRGALAESPARASLWGLPVLALAGALKLTSTWLSGTGQDAFASVSFPVVLWGAVLALYGPAIARVLLGPAAFIWFMCPLPGYAVAEASYPLQIAATQMGAALAQAAGASLYQDGTTIHLASFSLFVDVACSGFKSAVTVLTLGAFAAGMSRLRLGSKLLLLASAVPIGLIANAARIAVITVVADRLGRDGAVHAHDLSGLLMLGLACLCVLGMGKVLGWLDGTDTW